MFAFSALYMAIIGVCIAVPLENPSPDQAFPLLVETEPSKDIQTADQSEQLPNHELLNMEVEPSSDVKEYFDPRIVGGSDAPETKHMIALIVGWHVKSFTCGGSIISPKHVITAAHCIYKNWMDGSLLESYHGIVGSNTWNHGGLVVKFVSHLDHPEYNTATIKNDCAIIKTEEIPLSHRVQPIRMESNWVGGGVPCYVTGWGADQVWGGAAEVLQILHLQTISEEKCRRLVSDIVGQVNSAPIDYKLEICGFHSWGHGMCFGDSGSALVSKRNKRLVGIVSWGFPCAIGAPDMFVRVSAMWSFIEYAMKH